MDTDPKGETKWKLFLERSSFFEKVSIMFVAWNWPQACEILEACWNWSTSLDCLYHSLRSKPKLKQRRGLEGKWPRKWTSLSKVYRKKRWNIFYPRFIKLSCQNGNFLFIQHRLVQHRPVVRQDRCDGVHWRGRVLAPRTTPTAWIRIQVSISSTFYSQLLSVYVRSQKRKTVFFAHLGFAPVKAPLKTLMKWTTDRFG